MENSSNSIDFDRLMDLGSELENYNVEFAFGDIYTRDTLEHRIKTLFKISS